jgi:hypothetical protein
MAARGNKNVGIRLDPVTLDRVRFVAAAKGLDVSVFARRAIQAATISELQSMAAELQTLPASKPGRPRKPAPTEEIDSHA